MSGRWRTAQLKPRQRQLTYTYRGANVRIISARLAEPHESTQYEENR